MKDKPETCYSSGCPLAETGRGFCLGSGDPTKAKIMLNLEAPGRDEISFEVRPVAARWVMSTQAEAERELTIRRRDYPEMEQKFLRYGAPVVGATGSALNFWILTKVGIRREDIFFDNVLRCLPPKGKTSQYPTGEIRKEAERCCRQYDRIDKFKPDTALVTIHMASLLREITPLPLVVKDIEKARDFTSQGRRLIVLVGGKAAHAFLRYADNVTRWRGHYAALAENWSETYRSLFDYAAKKRKKAVRLTEEEQAEVDFFAVTKAVVKRAKEKKTRPLELFEGLCKSASRHRHKNPPKCSFEGCWTTYETKQQEAVCNTK